MACIAPELDALLPTHDNVTTMNIQHVVGFAAAAVIAATNVAGAQTIGTPADGEMSYNPPPAHASQSYQSTTPGDGELSYGPAISIPAAPPTVVATNGAPLDILDVSSVNHGDGNGLLGNSGGAVTISFENTAAVAATDVIFALDAAGQAPQTADLRGSFAPGVKIEHQVVGTPVAYGPAQLSVAEIQYSNGSIWRNQQGLPALRQAAAAL